MPTGISTTWGYSLEQVGGMDKIDEINNKPLTYQESLTSTYPSINNFVSPLTIANETFSSFGKKRKSKSIKKILSDISFLKKKK
jgi:hypothetical protein